MKRNPVGVAVWFIACLVWCGGVWATTDESLSQEQMKVLDQLLFQSLFEAPQSEPGMRWEQAVPVELPEIPPTEATAPTSFVAPRQRGQIVVSLPPGATVTGSELVVVGPFGEIVLDEHGHAPVEFLEDTPVPLTVLNRTNHHLVALSLYPDLERQMVVDGVRTAVALVLQQPPLSMLAPPAQRALAETLANERDIQELGDKIDQQLVKIGFLAIDQLAPDIAETVVSVVSRAMAAESVTVVGKPTAVDMVALANYGYYEEEIQSRLEMVIRNRMGYYLVAEAFDNIGHDLAHEFRDGLPLIAPGTHDPKEHEATDGWHAARQLYHAWTTQELTALSPQDSPFVMGRSENRPVIVHGRSKTASAVFVNALYLTMMGAVAWLPMEHDTESLSRLAWFEDFVSLVLQQSPEIVADIEALLTQPEAWSLVVKRVAGGVHELLEGSEASTLMPLNNAIIRQALTRRVEGWQQVTELLNHRSGYPYSCARMLQASSQGAWDKRTLGVMPHPLYQEPALVLVNYKLNFHTDWETGALDISNVGRGSLGEWQVYELRDVSNPDYPTNIPWLRAASMGGNTDEGGWYADRGEKRVMVTVDRTGLAPGSYRAWLRVCAADRNIGDALVQVDMIVLPNSDEKNEY